MGRLRRAWEALRGRNVYPSDIIRLQAEWVEYKAIFQDILERHSVMLARQAKMEKKRIERMTEKVAADTPPLVSSKAAIRARAAAMQGLSKYQRQLGRTEPTE